MARVVAAAVAAAMVAVGSATSTTQEPYATRIPWRRRPASGRTKHNISYLRRKLGEPAWKVWVCLVKKRDRLSSREAIERGEVWYGSESIAQELHFTVRQVRRALARLSNLGLVRPRANDEGVAPGWTHRRGALVYARIVYGSFANDHEVLVPREASRKLAKAGRGGARPGAGRPRKERAGEAPLGLLDANSKAGDPNSKAGTSNQDKQELLPALLVEDLKRPAEAGRSFFSTSSGTIGSFLGAASNAQLPPEIPPEAARLIPPMPSLGVVDPPTTPQPSDLPDDDEQDFALLGEAFNAAAKYLTGKPPSQFARKGMTIAELQRTLGACAGKLREHRLPPLVWAVWSIRSYNAYAVQKGAKRKRTKMRLPPLKWVFNPKRVEQHHGWCRSEMGCELGGTLFIPPSALALQRRWNAMNSEVHRLAQPTPDRIRVVVDAWFPEGTYDALLAAAIAESAAKRKEYEQGLARGIWIWEER